MNDRPRALIIATNGFEQSELFEPRQALIDAGIEVTLASDTREPIQGMKHDEKGETIRPDALLTEVQPGDYQALVIPGGVANPDKLRTDPNAIRIVRDFFARDATVAAICHGPWMLIEADVVKGKKVTSWPSLRTDLLNAGGEVRDAECVEDGNLITSRKPGDIPAFSEAVIRAVERQKVEEPA